MNLGFMASSSPSSGFRGPTWMVPSKFPFGVTISTVAAFLPSWGTIETIPLPNEASNCSFTSARLSFLRSGNSTFRQNFSKCAVRSEDEISFSNAL
jgi:hypothetical protein